LPVTQELTNAFLVAKQPASSFLAKAATQTTESNKLAQQ